MVDAPVLTAPRRFPGISPKAYEHPADRAATAALAQIPMLETVVTRLVEFGYERAYRQDLLASAVRLGPRQLSGLHAAHLDVLETLDVAEAPDLYLVHDPEVNAMTIGVGRPMVLLTSALLDVLEAAEAKAVLAHEAGHVLSGHVLYRTALQILLRLTSAGGLPGLAALPLRAVQMALLEWFRASELSSDRASALVVGDPRLVCRALMHVAAGRPRLVGQELDVAAFLTQAAEYEESGWGFDRVSRLWRELGMTHAYPVRRAQEVMRWVREGEYDRIVSGEYERRGDPVDPRAQAAGAADHYAERFSATFRDLGESLATTGEQLADWLRRGGR